MHKIWIISSHEFNKKCCTKCQNFRLKNTNSISAGALHQTPLGELTTLPDPLAGGGGLLPVHVQKYLQMDSIIQNLIYGTVREIYRDGIPKSNVGLLCSTLR